MAREQFHLANIPRAAQMPTGLGLNERQYDAALARAARGYPVDTETLVKAARKKLASERRRRRWSAIKKLIERSCRAWFLNPIRFSRSASSRHSQSRLR